MQFKIDEAYHFYLFLEKKLSYIELTILEPETIIECQPKVNVKKVNIKNDLMVLFTDFRLGAFLFKTSYSFKWLDKTNLISNEFTFYYDYFPLDIHTYQLSIANEKGYFTFNKSFEDIYNDKPLEVDLPPLKEISVKVIQNENPLEYQLNFIPDKFIQLKNENDQGQEIKVSNNNFFTNCSLCKVELIVEQNLLSQIVLLKDTFTQIEFNLWEEIQKSRRVIIKNNPYGDNLHLYCYYDKKSEQQSYLGQSFGKIGNLTLISPGIYQFQNILKGYHEILFFDVIDNTKLKIEEDDAETENKKKVPPPKRACFLGVNFFKGNSDEVIEIDFAKHKYFNINLKTADVNIKPMYLISLNEKFVQELKLYKAEADDESKLEYRLLLKQGKYRVFSYLDNSEFFITQNLEVNADETFQLSNDFINNATLIDSKVEVEDEKKIEGFYVSFKQELPIRNSPFQILKNLNCASALKPNHKYVKQDLSLFISAGNDEKSFNVNLLDKDSSFENTSIMNSKLKYIETNIDSKILQNSKIIFHKSLAPLHSEIQIINSFYNIAIEEFKNYRHQDDNYKKHIFLSNFEYLILPPMNKPQDKVQIESYGKVLFHFNNPHHHLFSFEILNSNDQIQNANLSDLAFFDTHQFYIDNTTNGNCFEFNFLEFGTHQLEISNLTTGITYKYPFQVTEKYQEIDVK